MATVRLEFELDAEVYPELHAALSALRSTRARAERMRQLASAGLVWEKVRLQGNAVVSPPPVEEMPTKPVPGLVMRPDVKPASPPAAAEPLPPLKRRGRPSRKDVEEVIRELPVLVDVVEDVSPLPDHHDEEIPDLSGPARWSSMNAYPDDVPDTSHADDDMAELPEAPLHITALSHKPATRSRLMRMKERGLFKNG